MHDLRSEVDDEGWAEQIGRDWRAAELCDGDRALLEFSEKLTLTPIEVGQADVDRLRAAGFDDVAIHDLVQVVSYFNYINRVAEGVGTDLEPDLGAATTGEDSGE